jgi:trimethylamine--corrinoid protein Co-methyltransferase
MTEATDRRRERRARQAGAAGPPAMRPITYDLPIYELLGPEGEQRIHDASMRILRELGIDFYDDEIRQILRAHGADVRGETVFFDEELILTYVRKAPGQFTQLSRRCMAARSCRISTAVAARLPWPISRTSSSWPT